MLDNIAIIISMFSSNQTDSVRRANKSMQDIRSLLSTREAEKKNTRQQMLQKEEELRVQEQKIYDVCEGQDLDEALEEVNSIHCVHLRLVFR